jgi:hypothetical protein
VRILDAAFEDEAFLLRNRLVQLARVDDDPTQVELRLRDLDGVSPTDALFGFVAPEDCLALASVGGGWAAPPDEEDGEEAFLGHRATRRPSAHPDAVRARIIVVVDRNGRTAGRTVLADGRTIDEPPSGGFVLDALHRALELPTPPARLPPSELLTALWLDNVVCRGHELRHRGRRLSWGAAARLHPALQLLRLSGARPRPDWLVPAAHALGRVLSWGDVHRQCVERGWLAGWYPPGAAEWMDEGMLARWLLSSLPGVPVLAADARRVLSPAADGAMVAALAELGVECSAG